MCLYWMYMYATTVNRFLSMEFQYPTLVIMNNFINLQLKLCSFFYLIVNDINVTEHIFIFLAFKVVVIWKVMSFKIAR